jgi:hypothetical protein
MRIKPRNYKDRTADGYAGVLRVIAVLNAKYDNTNAVRLVRQQVAEVGLGTNYEPDLEIFCPHHYGVEVKSMFAYYEREETSTHKGNRYSSRLHLPRLQWFRLKEWCEKNNAKPLVIVELKTRNQHVPFIYRKLDTQKMDVLLSHYTDSWVSASTWEIVELGERL